MKVYVALGSNLGQRELHIQAAFDGIADLPGVSAPQASSLYETEPMGPQDQPDYLNAVCGFDYDGQARLLMAQLQEIERQHGRQYGGQRWGARPLDLDILLFGEERIDDVDLIIPHIGLPERSFVLWPLMELAPTLVVPGMGSVQDLQQGCQQFGIKRHEQG
ncbi:2-amino-4-hydroxy-6-hydroxymethyldihydropteridine diphosphokinase [Granulosicoccus antarcticus]|uniref:2-amino-4-hydroxy-6- hydroxymethyldihydropteridine diphosphokinase n=1 Tax=Granulosicoccus antarcticus TaxID=437505 RepID=UPI00197AF67A|nr:2-amino-4-hydroxy-6-hydroxymethyldihydropteridine diphosphokinase [Granulosicoccus antarcticus]